MILNYLSNPTHHQMQISSMLPILTWMEYSYFI